MGRPRLARRPRRSHRTGCQAQRVEVGSRWPALHGEKVVTRRRRAVAGVGAALRARHDGHAVTLAWGAGRSLLPSEHFHLKRARDHPALPCARVNPEADLARSFGARDPGAARQSFDLRIANACEEESADRAPAGPRPLSPAPAGAPPEERRPAW
jgi:hypothetical protein